MLLRGKFDSEMPLSQEEELCWWALYCQNPFSVTKGLMPKLSYLSAEADRRVKSTRSGGQVRILVSMFFKCLILIRLL